MTTRFDLANDLARVLDRYHIHPASVDGVLDSLESVGLLDHLPEDDDDEDCDDEVEIVNPDIAATLGIEGAS